MVAKRDLASEIGEEAVRYYAGAKVLPNLIDINPGKLIAGLLDKLLQTDAYVFGGTECFSIERLGSGKFEINSNRGRLLADQVVIATQGVFKVTHELAHKIFPFLAHVVATEPIEPALMCVTSCIEGCGRHYKCFPILDRVTKSQGLYWHPIIFGQIGRRFKRRGS